MTARHLPPGRRSPSLTGIVNPFGADHWSMSSVHAFHTSSRGALNVRLMTSSRSLAVWVSLLFAATFLLLCLYFVQVIVQAVKALIPVLPIVVDPRRRILEWLSLEPARAPLSCATVRDEIGAVEHLHIRRQRRPFRPERLVHGGPRADGPG